MFKKKSVCTVLLATACWGQAAMAADAPQPPPAEWPKSVPVTGKPYIATQTITQRRVLADGNEIVTETKVRYYRDSAGRQRSETVVAEGGTGSFVLTGLDGIDYQIDPVRKLAVRQVLMRGQVDKDGTVASVSGVGVTAERLEQFKAETQARWQQETNRKSVSLGQREIDGVMAKGFLSTVEIAAGAAGNLMPIVVTTEVWSSTELGRNVYQKNTDPRKGETIIVLSDIQRVEPDAALFVVPEDYQYAASQLGVRPQ